MLRPPRLPAPLLVLLATLLLPAALRGQTRYTITDLGTTGLTSLAAFVPDTTQARGINASGAATGYVLIGGSKRAFLHDGTLRNLGTLGGADSEGFGVNSAGDVAGVSLNAGGAQRAFRHSAGAMLDLGTLGGTTSIAYAINNAGQIVGTAKNAAGADRGFLWANGVMQDLGTLGGATTYAFAINNAGQIAGASKTSAGADHAFLRTGTTLRDLGTLGGATSYAYGVNDAGDVVGVSASVENTQRAFLFRNNQLVDLGFLPGGDRAQANAINNADQIVGWGTVPGTTAPRAFIYQTGVMTNLSDFTRIEGNATARFLSLTTANGINDAGQIVGYGFHNDGTYHVFLLAPIVAPPQPVVSPATITAATGSTVRFAVSNPAPNTAYTWTRTGSTAVVGSGPALLLTNVSAANAGSYTVVGTNSAGTSAAGAATLALSATTDVGRLINLSIRTTAGTDPNVLTVGFVVRGTNTTDPKPLLLRGIGPALALFGLGDVLTDPSIAIVRTDTGATLATNDNWAGNTQVVATAAAVGAFPLANTASADAALATSLGANSYTMQVTGAGGATGVALAEIYDATPAGAFGPTTPRLINVSARSQAGSGDQTLIAGFVIGGTTARTVLIRAIGPGLQPFGVPGVLADPKLELRQSSTLIASNDNWGGDSTLTSVGTSVGAFAIGNLSSQDAMLLVTLAPGVYTAQASAATGANGVALIEVYEVP